MTVGSRSNGLILALFSIYTALPFRRLYLNHTHSSAASTLPTCYLPQIPPIQAGLIDQPLSATPIAIQEIDDGVTHRHLPR